MLKIAEIRGYGVDAVSILSDSSVGSNGTSAAYIMEKSTKDPFLQKG